MRIGIIILAFIFLGLSGAEAASLPAPTSSIHPATLFNQPMFTASLETTELTGRVGSPTLVHIQLAPKSIPFGHFIVSLAEVIKGPDGPPADILTGYPEIRVTPKVAGKYQLMVRVNLVVKSSCGGAEATTLLKKMVHLVVVPE